MQRFYYRKEYIEGMSLKAASINVLHNGVACHIKFIPVKRLKINCFIYCMKNKYAQINPSLMIPSKVERRNKWK